MLQKISHWIQNRPTFEKIGVGLSFICAIHCALTPLFIAFLPLVSSKVFHNSTIDAVLLGSSFLIVGITNLIGFVRHHQKYAPLVYMLLGFSLILSGHSSHVFWLEIGASVIGGCLIAYSIFVNTKATHDAKEDCCHQH